MPYSSGDYSSPSPAYYPPADYNAPPADNYGPPANTYSPPANTYGPPVKHVRADDAAPPVDPDADGISFDD